MTIVTNSILVFKSILKQTPNATQIWRTLFCFYIYSNIFHWKHFSTIIKIWLHWQKYFLPRTDEHGLLDEKRKSRCTWKWWVLSGKHMYHSTVQWLSKDNGIIKITIKSLENTKTWTQFHNTLIRIRFNPIYFMQKNIHISNNFIRNV